MHTGHVHTKFVIIQIIRAGRCSSLFMCHRAKSPMDLSWPRLIFTTVKSGVITYVAFSFKDRDKGAEYCSAKVTLEPLTIEHDGPQESVDHLTGGGQG